MNEQQRENLRILSDYLIKLDNEPDLSPVEFGMGSFFLDPDTAERGVKVARRPRHGCGTSACAVGHGPFAGVEIPDGVLSWDTYTYECFGVSMGGLEWEFLFSPCWVSVDNTPRGAGMRIRYFLKKGIPGEFTDGFYVGSPYPENFGEGWVFDE